MRIFLFLLLSAAAGRADAQTVNLTINLSPASGGTVGVIPSANLCNTGASCTYSVASGTAIRVVANTPLGSAPGVFSVGTGSAAACATSTCSFTITTDSAITATFGGPGVTVKTVTVALAGDTAGEVGMDNNRCQNVDPPQGSSCTTNYAAGSVVSVGASPAAGSKFTAFSNGTQGAASCSTTPCTFTLNDNATVTATFHALTSVSVSPSSLTIGPGPSLSSFTANGTYSDGVTQPIVLGMGTWITKTSMPTPRFDLAAVAANGLVYAIGGVDASAPRDTVESYDPAANTWTSRASMPTAREGLAAGLIGGFIYAAGGNQPGSTPTSVLEAYDVATNTWSSKASMPAARRFVAGAVLNGLLYVMGGETTGGIVATVEAYDPATNTWTTRAPMPTARRMLAAAVVNGMLYAIGGMGSDNTTILTTVEAYDAATNTWTTKASLPSPRELLAAAVIDDDLYVVGGNYGGNLATVNGYDTGRNIWFIKSTMPTGRSEVAAAVVNGRLYAVGGHVAQGGSPPMVPTGKLESFTDHVLWSTADARIGDVTGTGQPVGISYGSTTITARGGAIACAGAACGTLISLTNMTTDRSSLAFGAINTNGTLSSVTPPQTVTVTFGSGVPVWVAVPTTPLPWLQVTGGSGNGNGQFTIAVVSSSSLPTIGTVTGTVTVVSGAAMNSPKLLSITVNVQPGQTSTNAPFGAFDTPANGATVQGSIPITGWALDDVGLDRVEIWRDLVVNETTVPFNAPGHLGHGKVFIARALFIPGARPDVETNFPNSPIAYRAGWGYLLLTWGLWDQGNGPYTLFAFAYDKEGKSTTLGTKTITGINRNGNKPFGALDTPSEGQTVSGRFWNYGWSLTPRSGTSCGVTNGNVLMGIDSRPLVPVSYGDNRTDIAGFFPGFVNTNGAGGAHYIDTTTLTNGIHQIGWFVTDNCGRSDGIGSRFFTVLNGSSLGAGLGARDSGLGAGDSLQADALRVAPRIVQDVARDLSPAVQPAVGRVLLDPASGSVAVRQLNGDWTDVRPNEAGLHIVGVEQSGRIEVQLPAIEGAVYSGVQIANGGTRALPLGSSLDAARGVFYWQPAAGFLGSFDLEFSPDAGSAGPGLHVGPDVGRVLSDPPSDAGSIGPGLQPIRVRVVVGPSIRMAIDTPAAGVVAQQPLVVAGWALDLSARDGSGIDTVHVWAYPATGEPTLRQAQGRPEQSRGPIFLGVAGVGDARPDVAATYGAQFSASSYTLVAPPLAPGTYDVVVYPHRAATASFDGAQIVRISVR